MGTSPPACAQHRTALHADQFCWWLLGSSLNTLEELTFSSQAVPAGGVFNSPAFSLRQKGHAELAALQL